MGWKERWGTVGVVAVMGLGTLVSRLRETIASMCIRPARCLVVAELLLGCGTDDGASEDACVVGIRCTSDTDCSAGSHCRDSDNECVKLFCLGEGRACDSDDLCKEGLSCRSGGAEEQTCRGSDGTSGSECRTQSDCSAGLTCGTPDYFDCPLEGGGLCREPQGQDGLCCWTAECRSGLTCQPNEAGYSVCLP